MVTKLTRKHKFQQGINLVGCSLVKRMLQHAEVERELTETMFDHSINSFVLSYQVW